MWAIIFVVVSTLSLIAIINRTTMPTMESLPVPVESQPNTSQP